MYESIKNGKFALKQAVRYTKEGSKETRKERKKTNEVPESYVKKKMNSPYEIEEARSFVKKMNINK